MDLTLSDKSEAAPETGTVKSGEHGYRTSEAEVTCHSGATGEIRQASTAKLANTSSQSILEGSKYSLLDPPGRQFKVRSPTPSLTRSFREKISSPKSIDYKREFVIDQFRIEMDKLKSDMEVRTIALMLSAERQSESADASSDE
ncbi:hypothetical protein Pmar_PMAR017259 [Perkinsus marinus ATCC 50983]|uniref:Uncharacterized protein n=1 Tax=Perkinsus marinus (strain ATCC 50983 / TXsc) TaxID=423536 RepID=C5LH39_PERM5|nr:hypothetical protein Pmar_PMAR017259 [Perkinsus marinus ATCC 50983]EER03848.1 hypothetical protein Pmar_PMAR017259 [Perkinsus marinus ATCC 50983]|eukprot:XP_002772032.1 hypothetical protein Pmar_PMAR017259 [Perkinsus marinus ATCC 50983]